jgi:hypothetical protein
VPQNTERYVLSRTKALGDPTLAEQFNKVRTLGAETSASGQIAIVFHAPMILEPRLGS